MPGREVKEPVSDYVVLDLETTGLSPQNDEIIEIGAVMVRNNTIVDAFSQLVRPERPISYFITRLTGISNRMTEGAPPITAVLPAFLDFAGDSIILGHNLKGFDLKFIRNACGKYLGRGFDNDYIDTVIISRRLFPKEKHKLSDLELKFGLHNEHAHRALSDVVLTKQVYDKLKEYM